MYSLLQVLTWIDICPFVHLPTEVARKKVLVSPEQESPINNFPWSMKDHDINER